MKSSGRGSGLSSSKAVVCGGCRERHKRCPSSWAQSNRVNYCPACWDAIRCTLCGHRDPRGSAFREQWQCRQCTHTLRSKSRQATNVQEVCHQMIIEEDDSNNFAPRAEAQPKGLWAHEDEDGEGGDELAPLPVATKPRPKPQNPIREEVSHVVLLLDSSGSMRTEDVDQRPSDSSRSSSDAGDQAEKVCRLEAASRCAWDFITSHAAQHPNDIFSIATIAADSAAICHAVPAPSAKESLERLLPVRGSGGTFFKPALERAALFLEERPDVSGHLVLLSDGRPADTKVALACFQDLFVRGKYQNTRLHGIAFGATVESYAPLQQLACIGGGAFVMSGCSIRSLSAAFTSVSSSITSIKSGSTGTLPSAPRNLVARQVDYEQPDLCAFGKKGVLTFRGARKAFRFDGKSFHSQCWPAGVVHRRVRPHMRGGMRLVYGFRDEKVVPGEAGWMVAKLSRFANVALNSSRVVEGHARSTAVARYYAGMFNERLGCKGGRRGSTEESTEPAIDPKLIFVSCFVYITERRDVAGCCEPQGGDIPAQFTAERYLPGVFLKYNSNNGYVNDGGIRHDDIVQAFLHFSFVASGGELVVADLQGVAREGEVLLTDPQVLSVAPLRGSESQAEGHEEDFCFGPGDLGARGAKACLAAHRCGPTCRRLGLKPVSGPMLRKLEAAAAARAGSSAVIRRGDASSGASWEHVGSESSAGAPGAPDWERISEYALTDLELRSDGMRSSQVSGSSWVHLLDT